MHFALVDWVIVAAYLACTIAAGLWMRRYVKGVRHYIVAGHAVDTYLGVASLAATELGLVTVMYVAEFGYKNGFSGAIPGVLLFAAMLFVGLSGFVINPLRRAGVMTIPEYFEKRFSRGVRWLAGVFVALGGLLNMGIFFRLGGQFLVHVTGMDPGWLVGVMTGLVAVVMVYTIAGGMLSVLVTDYLQFIFLGVGIVATTVVVLGNQGWTGLTDAVARQYHDGGFNPFAHPDLGWGYVVWQAIFSLAVVVCWQPTVARILASADARTGRRIYTRTSFYYVGRFLLPGIWGIGALAALGPAYLAPGQDSLAAMPTYLGQILPAGILGLVVAGMLAAEMSTDSGYLLTWSSVIYNDILGPLRRRPHTPREGVLWNRGLVLVIGLLLLLFGLWYEIPGRAWDFLAVTGNIYLASMFSLLLAGLYWRRATAAGAYAALCLGAVMPLVFLLLPLLGGAEIRAEIAGGASFLMAAAGMVVGSLLTEPMKAGKGEA